MKNCERHIAVEAALEKITQTLAIENLVVDFHAFGDQVKTYQYYLSKPNTKQRFVGCGKGIGLQSQVSAAFEAFEHYAGFMSVRKLYEEGALTYCSLSDLPNWEYYAEHNVLPAHMFKTPYRDQKTYWARYQHCTDTKQSLLFPVFLQEPRYPHTVLPKEQLDFHSLSWLASDNGTASGTHFDETVIHGLNEVIERDAMGLFFIDAFLRKTPKVRMIDAQSLPATLQKLHHAAEQEAGSRLRIFDITSDVGVPVICVSALDYEAPIPVKGFGASLNPAYAIERALLEVLQPIHIRTPQLTRDENQTIEKLAQWPLLQRAAIGDLKPIVDQHHTLSAMEGQRPRRIVPGRRG